MNLAVRTTDLAALLVVISFAAGLNVYATVATLGLLARFDVVSLPQTLHLLTSSVATHTYINPTVAVVLGWALASERVTLTTLLAGVLVLIAIALIQRGTEEGVLRTEAKERSLSGITSLRGGKE